MRVKRHQMILSVPFVLALAVTGAYMTSAQAISLNVGAVSDDWGNPAVALSGNPSDGFLRVFGLCSVSGVSVCRGAMEFDISSIGPGAVMSCAK